MKIGVIGAGHLGKIHLKCLAEIPEFQVVGFADTNADTRQKVSEQYGIPAYSDYKKLLAEVDVASIVVPTSLHYEVCRDALYNDCHIFVEKPVCSSVSEAKRLIELHSEKPHLKFQVGHVERFNPAFLAVKDHMIKPEFIEVHRLANFNPRSTDVSVVHDLMIHDLDIIMHLVSEEVKEVRARGVAIVSPTHDIVNARIEFEGGCVANLTASRLSIKNMRKLRIFQSNAYLSLDFLEKSAEVIRLHSDAGPDGEFMKLDGIDDSKYLEIATPKVLPVNAIKEEFVSLYKSIVADADVVVSLFDGYRALLLAEKIVNSAHVDS